MHSSKRGEEKENNREENEQEETINGNFSVVAHRVPPHCVDMSGCWNEVEGAIDGCWLSWVMEEESHHPGAHHPSCSGLKPFPSCAWPSVFV